MKAKPWKRCRSGAGAALVIVLAFIVLIAALMVLFFTQAISYRNIGNSSFNNFKSTALAQSGLATVVGDLQQEITNGSTTINYGTTTFPTNVYYPTTNFNAVPQRQANVPATIPNLIRTSRRTDPIVSPGVGSRASADSSTNAAVSGQYISPARWNQHYLIPRLNAGTTGIDTTPISDFTNFCAPDWVYVTSGGPTVITAPSTKVFGRYAYAIYDEGGLLDANVAGFPSNTSTNAVHPASPTTYQNNSYGAALPVWGSGLKGTEAFADLTAIGLTQAQIDQLVGWRHNATAQPTGTYNSYTFNATSAVNYHDWMVNATNGYLATSGHSWTDPTTSKTDTDQVFASRQALIAFANDANPPISQDALQYLATFTRDTEQPVYNPPVGRPMVLSSATVNAASVGTGNDAYHVDRYSTTPTTNSSVDINPPFLYERVGTGGWPRADGTAAVAGEPLIKERFPLSRLTLFPVGNVAPSTANAALISQYFGLTYQPESGTTPAIWLYNPDGATTAGIDKLSVVASLNREPNFFELLKAAINVASVGKGSASNENNNAADNYTTAGSIGNLLQSRDTLSALHILQIGANIIDQSKADNFPTRIQFAGDPTVPPNVVCGSEDLPYLYRVRNWISQPSATQVNYLVQPELWDPYSYSAAAASGQGSSGFVSASNAPTKFRVRLEPDPTLSSTATPINFVVFYGLGDTSTLTNVSLNYPNYQNSTSAHPNPAPLTFNAGELNGFWGFREPTLLSQPTSPSSANINSGSPYSPPNYTDVNNHANLTGFLIATFPWASPTGTASDNGNKVNVQPSAEPSCLRCYLDYMDASGNYVTYDQQPIQYQGGASSNDIHVIQNAINNTYTKSLTSANYDDCGWVRTDPRTSRWGAEYTEYFYDIPILNLTFGEFSTMWAGGGISFGSHLGGKADLGFKVTSSYGTEWRGDQHGYYSENSVRITYQTDGTDSDQRFYCDPDGVPRRTMGGYVTDTANGGNVPTAAQNQTGLPFYTCESNAGGNGNYSSRPTILHRPFRSVSELSYAFRGTPWGNINFSFPESGDSPLLDVFSVNDTSSTAGMVAGRVDLNTRQAPVLEALFSGTLLDKDNPSASFTQGMGSDLASRLVARTTGTTVSSTTQGPLVSRADLVGTWMGGTVPTTSGTTLTSLQTHNTSSGIVNAIDPNNYYTGFSYDIGTSLVPSINASPNIALITRQRDAAMRALVDVGTTRTWNLLIDLVAESGQFPPAATGFSGFVVEGEKHYWLHVAIDRYTGKIIDSQLEVVSE